MRQSFQTAFGGVVVAAALLLLGGCSADNQSVMLWSDHPDAAAIAEVFNASQERYHVTLRHTRNVANDLVTEQRQPDLVLAQQLANASTFPYLRNVGRLLPDEAEEKLYSDLLSLGEWEGEQRLIPVSFDLPLIMFRSGSNESSLPDFSFSLESLQELGAAFNNTEGEQYTRMGFSPRWSRDFLYLATRIGGAEYRELSVRELTWDPEALSATIDMLQQWTAQRNGGVEVESTFSKRYLYDPPYQLIQRNRVRFWFSSATEYYSYSQGERHALDYRWLSANEAIPALESLRFFGIPKEAQNAAGARAFLSWWAQEQTQRQLLRAARRKSLLSFGLLDGFTAFPAVNEELLPQLYPSLLGMVPAEPDLLFPARKPKEWDKLRDEVVEQWLYREVSGMSHEGALGTMIDKWLRQRGE